MAYTTIDDPSAYFHTQLFTGNNNTTQSITNNANSGNFQADWLWIKNRDNIEKHHLMDSSRGANKFLHSNEDAAERTGSHASGHNDINSFSSNGFTITSNGSNDELNFGTRTYVAWQWKANGGTTASNTDGTITSTVQANTTAGFSIVTWTGNATNPSRIGHGLNQTPDVILLKNRDASSTNWIMYHSANTSAPETDYLILDSTNATTDSANVWADTSPTSSVFTVGSAGSVNNNGNAFITYCFAEKQGYSKFGSYTGNGNADGPFIYTGFKPAWFMLKATDDSGRNWIIHNSKMAPTNVAENELIANLTDAEVDNSRLDILSNGIKLRSTSLASNKVNINYIYMAFAESPFVSSEGVPTTAR